MSKFITKVTFKTTPYGKKETRTPHFAPPKRQKIYTYSIFKDVVSERNELQVSGKKKSFFPGAISKPLRHHVFEQEPLISNVLNRINN